MKNVTERTSTAKDWAEKGWDAAYDFVIFNNTFGASAANPNKNKSEFLSSITESSVQLEYFSVVTFYPMTEIPEMMPDEYKSYDVLIDVDGWRKDFRVGYYHIDGDGKGHWNLYSDEKTDVKIDLEHARWTYPPLAARDKK